MLTILREQENYMDNVLGQNERARKDDKTYFDEGEREGFVHATRAAEFLESPSNLGFSSGSKKPLHHLCR
jgi:hypothetical protein